MQTTKVPPITLLLPVGRAIHLRLLPPNDASSRGGDSPGYSRLYCVIKLPLRASEDDTMNASSLLVTR